MDTLVKQKLQKIIEKLNLQAHPEGGFFKETYRSEGKISQSCLSEVFTGDRNYCTAIYFLLTSDNFSAFHKINQDETWHFYEGSPIEIHEISAQGVYKKSLVGADLNYQYTVAAGSWFGATVPKDNTYSLVGCTVAPGFDFKDFKLAERINLLNKFPQHSEIITKLTRV